MTEGSPRDLVARHTTREVVEVRHDGDGARRALVDRLAGALDGIARVEGLPDRALVYTDTGEAAAGWLAGHGVPAAHVHVRRATLEDVFLHLAGRTLTD